MPPSQTSRVKAVFRAEHAQRQDSHSTLRLSPSMASDTAFRVLARRFLDDLAANLEATCRGDPAALHQTRMALTRLRTAISFFSPIATDTDKARIKRELKWLNSHLGAARDMDVTLGRLKQANKHRPLAIEDHRSWEEKRTESHRRLTRSLRSARYRRLVENIYQWAENGPWSTKKGKQATKARGSPIPAYSAQRLTRWRKKLLKKSCKIRGMGSKKRHRLRLANKKLYYSTEFVDDLFPAQKDSRQQPALKHLRKAQKSLGRLNDDANTRSLAATLQRDGPQAHLRFLGPKRKKRLIRKAAKAYRKLAALKPLRA
jgi:CHAD domain-containing protein